MGIDCEFGITLVLSTLTCPTEPMLKTETPDQQHAELDQYPTAELVNTLVDDQINAVNAVRAAAPRIAAAVTAALPRIEAGGRLIYVGAGTSGRLGVLDSVELYPTFSWPHERAVALLAGGTEAMFVAVEGAEDDIGAGRGRPARRQRRPQRRGAAAGRVRRHAVCAGRPARRARSWAR